MDDSPLRWLRGEELVLGFATQPPALRLTLNGERSFPHVVPQLGFPLSDPDGFVVLYAATPSGAVREAIGVIESVATLAQASRDALTAALGWRYVLPRILEIADIRARGALSVWTVVTDLGPRTFEMERMQENVQRTDDNRAICTDIDGIRYQIADIRRLPPASRARLERLL
jgi:hypothetical protein